MKNLKLMTLILILAIFNSCEKDEEINSQTLSGIYMETSPVNGRSQLNFIDENTVIKTEIESSTEDEYIYELNGNIITLTHVMDSSSTTFEFDIELMNSSEFEIENLYPSIPENPTTYMTFEKL